MAMEVLSLISGKGLVAVLGILSGGLGVKVIDWLQSRNLKKIDDAQKIRAELWQELNNVRNEVYNLRNEVTEWKEKYFALFADYTALEGRYHTLKEQFEIFVNELRSKE